MLTSVERRLLSLEESAPPNIWIPDRRRRSPEAYMRDLEDFHLSVRKDAETGRYRAEVVERQKPSIRVWWGKDFESRFAACNAAIRKAQERLDPSLPRTPRILTPNQKAVDETEPAYVIGQVALSQGLGQELNGWISKLTAGAPTIYDKAMDSVYNATGIGGSLHRQFDGGHTIIGAFRAARDAAPNDSILQELVGTSIRSPQRQRYSPRTAIRDLGSENLRPRCPSGRAVFFDFQGYLLQDVVLGRS